jgi:DNA-binding beta-propeller fold protein YncE
VPRHAAALLVAVLATAALSATALAAASAPVGAASARAHGSRRQHIGAERFRALGRPDRLSVGWNRDRGGSGSASARRRLVSSDRALLFGLGASMGPFGFGSAFVGSAPVQPGPSAVAVDPATHTIYVASGFNSNGLLFGGDTVSVIDARRCNAHDVSRCKGPWPTITVGNLPSGVAVDTSTDTLYVSNAGDGTVSVVNGATCNALTSAGCGQTPATVPVGSEPLGLFADGANHTVYVANFGDGTVSMIDSATCDAADQAGCPSGPAQTVAVGGNPGDVDVNQTTHTVYAANVSGLSAFNADSCNASNQSGCASVGQAPVQCDFTLIPFCGPFTAKVDSDNNTIYESGGSTTVWVFDGRNCDAADLAGCATDTPGEVTPFRELGFEADVWVAVDAPLHTVYVTYEKDDALLVIDANRCNGSNLAACATLNPPEIHTGAEPESVALDPQTQTLYAGNEVSGDVSVIDPTQCDAQTTAGCRARLPEAPIGSEASVTADPAVATAYVVNGSNVSMLDTSSCNAHHPAGCSATPPTMTAGTNPQAVAVDPPTHTVYVANAGSGTVSVFDDRGCNATEQAGCSTVETLNVPAGNPVDIAVNRRTDTIYVATITSNGGPNLISVFNGSTCNAKTTSACNQIPSTAPTGDDNDGVSTEAVAVNSKTNTIYATSDTTGSPFFGDTVYVIDGPTCDAADMAGCANPPATISVGSDPLFGDANPFGIAVNENTDTIYTANIFNGEGPGTVSVINGATCNAQTTSGCDQTPATAPAGFGANGIAVDPTTNQVYATNIQDTSVTTINGNTCNSANHNGCHDSKTRAIVGDYPGSISIDPQTNTAYVADIEGVSIMPLTP